MRCIKVTILHEIGYKREALKNIGEFVRRVEHHLIFLWIDANKRDVHAMCADIKFVMIYLPRKVV